MIVRIDNEDAPVDTILERFEGVQLVGKERPFQKTGSAILGECNPGRGHRFQAESIHIPALAACKSQILLGHTMMAYIVTEKGHESLIEPAVRLIGSLSNLSAGYVVSWSPRSSTEVVLQAIPKQEPGTAIRGTSDASKEVGANAWYLNDEMGVQDKGVALQNVDSNRLDTEIIARAIEPIPELKDEKQGGILKVSQGESVADVLHDCTTIVDSTNTSQPLPTQSRRTRKSNPKKRRGRPMTFSELVDEQRNHVATHHTEISVPKIHRPRFRPAGDCDSHDRARAPRRHEGTEEHCWRSFERLLADRSREVQQIQYICRCGEDRGGGATRHVWEAHMDSFYRETRANVPQSVSLTLVIHIYWADLVSQSNP